MGCRYGRSLVTTTNCWCVGIILCCLPCSHEYADDSRSQRRPVPMVASLDMQSFLRGKKVFEIPEGTPIPDGLQLLHEHTDHFSLQTSGMLCCRHFCGRVTYLPSPPSPFRPSVPSSMMYLPSPLLALRLVPVPSRLFVFIE
jgi:hypothetical protein